MNIKERLREISSYINDNEYDKIKVATLNMEKDILNNYKSHNEFKRLIDNICYYSDYSFFNTLLVDYQYPNFLELGTKEKYNKNGYDISENAKAINILTPNNDTFVKITDNGNEMVKSLKDLTKEQIQKYNNPKDNSVVLHHKNLKELKVLELFDCKDTNMLKEEYKELNLPALLQNNYNDVYKSFVKAMYADGYKIKYVDNLDNKFEYDKDNKIIHIKNGLNNRIKILGLIDIMSDDVSSDTFEKELFKHTINKGIGIDDNFDDKFNLLNWYKSTDIKNVDKTFKLLSSKSRKFINNFNRFFDLEYEFSIDSNKSLYDDFSLKI